MADERSELERRLSGWADRWGDGDYSDAPDAAADLREAADRLGEARALLGRFTEDPAPTEERCIGGGYRHCCCYCSADVGHAPGCPYPAAEAWLERIEGEAKP